MALQRYSVFDHMERKGAFEGNPANPNSRDAQGQSLYKGPVGYPKMFYSPKGEENEVSPAHLEFDRGREFTVPAKYEMKTAVADGPEAERKLRAAGWHDHPAKSVEAGNKERVKLGLAPKLVPEMSSAELASRKALAAAAEELEERDEALHSAQDEIRKLKAELASRSKN